MKIKYIALVVILLSGNTIFAVNTTSCKLSDAVGTICTLHLSQLRPTQFAVGTIAASCKADKISKKSKKKLKRYLAKAKRQFPTVIGPDGKFYITDHHHLAFALSQAQSSDWNNDDKVVHVEIIDNHFPNMTSLIDFWAQMHQHNRVYNYDNKGTPDMNFSLIPKNVDSLLNDPYRTLSKWVRESCGYVKKSEKQCNNIRTYHEHKAPFFMEFYWGNFFRQELPLKINDLTICHSIPYSSLCLDNEVDQLKAIYKQSIELARSEKAKNYFESLGLNPWDYGYNPSGKHLPLRWKGKNRSCEGVEKE